MADKTYYDAIFFKKGRSGKSFAVRLGTALKSDQHEGFTAYLDALPAPVDGQYIISIVPPREKKEGTQGASGTPPDRKEDDMDDSIPF